MREDKDLIRRILTGLVAYEVMEKVPIRESAAIKAAIDAIDFLANEEITPRHVIETIKKAIEFGTTNDY